MTSHNLLQLAQSEKDWIVGIRRELHQYPELKYQEVRTSQLVRKSLKELGIEPSPPMAVTGMVATIGNGNGPCIGLRADMDALPIHEETGLEFQSKVPGVMHACGHDCHTAMLLGAAKILKSMEPQIQGTIKLIFQPAEEGGAGGSRMIQEGALENPKVDRIFGIHVWPDLETGKIGGRSGPFLAAVSSFRLVVRGKGGHAAFPHKTHDPVLAMSHIVCALQSIVSRECDPICPSVVSVTAIHGGDAFNVIGSEVVAMGTIRSMKTEGLASLRLAIERVAMNVAIGFQCTAEVETIPGDPDYPATVNKEPSWHTACLSASELVSESNVSILDPVLGGEDFAFYLEKTQGCFVALGTRNESQGAIHFVHTPYFKVDEDALPIGAALHAAFALRSLEELR
jgi:IAA-amino acid hydrolase